MMPITRRSFLAASAAAAASPAFAAPAPATETEVAIIGAGAAGIAAATRIAAAGRRFEVIEAAARLGGRCITDTKIFGVPFDLGAHWAYGPDNPVTKATSWTELNVYPAPTGQRVRIGQRNARENELEDFLDALVRSNRGIAEAAQGKTDVNCARALPRNLGDWQPVAEFVLGAYPFGKDLNELSAVDVTKSAPRDSAVFCRQGYGALLARLAAGMPAQFSSPVTRIVTPAAARVDVHTAKGVVTARYAIVTASTGVLAAGKIKFEPELPKRQLDAIAALKLGSLDHIALELAGNPLNLQPDELVFEKSDGKRTAALLANVSGTPLAVVDVGGSFGRELSAKGERAMIDFATEWLANLYGADIRKAVKRSHATRWNAEPWALGAIAAAAPGNQSARGILTEPVRDRIYFAGEAVHETLWGTVGGAWDSGIRAAEAILRKMGVALGPAPARRPR